MGNKCCRCSSKNAIFFGRGKKSKKAKREGDVLPENLHASSEQEKVAGTGKPHFYALLACTIKIKT